MAMKTFRCYYDVVARNEDDAIKKLDEMVREEIEDCSDVANLFIVQENPFSEEEETIIYELASEGLSDGEVFDYIANELDIADDVLTNLQDKLEKVINTKE